MTLLHLCIIYRGYGGVRRDTIVFIGGEQTEYTPFILGQKEKRRRNMVMEENDGTLIIYYFFKCYTLNITNDMNLHFNEMSKNARPNHFLGRDFCCT